MEFVTFHVSLRRGEEVHPNQTLIHAEYISNIDMMLASARMNDRCMTGTVLTDEDTSLNGIHTPYRRYSRPIRAEALMYDRTMTQLQYILESRFESPLVLLDSDILINGDLARLTERDFDVAVTWRKLVKMPINGGLLILNNQRPERSRSFFEQFATIFTERYLEQAGWYGDQLALRDLIGLTHQKMAEQEIVEAAGCRVLLLPCERYNFSPDNSFTSIETGLRDKHVLHFKGPRKSLMGPFYHGWLRPRHSWSPIVKLAGLMARQQIRQKARLERIADQQTKAAASC